MVTLLIEIASPHFLYAAAKPRPPRQSEGKTSPTTDPFEGKRVIELEETQSTRIELPNEKEHAFGEDFTAGLVHLLVNSRTHEADRPHDRYIVTSKDTVVRADTQEEGPADQDLLHQDEYIWSGSVLPAARIHARILALTFETGSRGEKMIYGFDERQGNAAWSEDFSDCYQNCGNSKGSENFEASGQQEKNEHRQHRGFKNEFPLQTQTGTPYRWFGNTFDAEGTAPFDSRSGLDLGQGFSLDALFAWLHVKVAHYLARIRLAIDFEVAFTHEIQTQEIDIQTKGFFYDVVAGYDRYSAGITVARTDALLRAAKNALTASGSLVEPLLRNLPLTARVDAILTDGTILLGTGPYSEIPSGFLFQSVNHLGLVLQVEKSGASGSVARLRQGALEDVFPGLELRQADQKHQPQGLNTDSQFSFPSGSRLPASSPSYRRSFGSLKNSSQDRFGQNSEPVFLSGKRPTHKTSGRQLKTAIWNKPLFDLIEHRDSRISAYLGRDQEDLASLAEKSLFRRDTLRMDKQNLSEVNLDGLVPKMSRAEALAKSLMEGIFLPYRIYRYFQYDQPYHRIDDLGRLRQDGPLGMGISSSTSGRTTNSPTENSLPKDANWVSESEPRRGTEPQTRNEKAILRSQGVNAPIRRARKHLTWKEQVGLSSSFEGGLYAQSPSTKEGASPIVAIIDTGVDYNHPALHASLWLNPAPWTDPRGRIDRYGWDFVSGDSRPYDDHYHGTELASLVVRVAPSVQILPIKSFNPYGVTRSQWLYDAFQYATEQGASVILCGWATPQASLALKAGIELAERYGVVVVAAAGDEGKDLDQEPRYPASFSQETKNVVSVTGVNLDDQLLDTRTAQANRSAAVITLAAPAENITVAQPRNHWKSGSSTAYSAALVAGATARILASDYPELIALRSSYAEKLKQSSSSNPKKEPHSLTSDSGSLEDLSGSHEVLIRALLESTEPIPSLTPHVSEGRRLKLR